MTKNGIRVLGVLVILAVTGWSAAAAVPQPDWRLSFGLRAETVNFVMQHRGDNAIVSASSITVAAETFPKLDGWVRVLTAPSLDALRRIADNAKRWDTPYEVLGYRIEMGAATPPQEKYNLVASTMEARAIADEYGKLLLIIPDLPLMSQTKDAYASMAALSDIWGLDTAEFQNSPPSRWYWIKVFRETWRIRAANPDITIWAQILVLPNGEPNAETWLAYHWWIAGLVDAAHVGIYQWGSVPDNLLLETMEKIRGNVCPYRSLW